MQCKDIPDSVFLKAVWDTPGAWENGGEDVWRMEWEVRKTLDVVIPNIPDRLFRAKARRLIERDLLDGCACGCRGDYYLTEAGKNLIKSMII